jgi:hypothetical protein
MRCRPLLAALLGALAGPAAAQTLPDGLYDCWIGTMNLGQIAVQGGLYNEPAHDARFDAATAHPFTMEGPTIIWGGPLGGLSGVGTIVSTAAKGEADGTFSGFDVMIEMSESGSFQTVSCYAPS